MAEIKLNEGFAAEVEAFRSAGEAINKVVLDSVSAEGISLPTVEAYQDRLYRIWRIMLKFCFLTKKDAADMDKLAATLKAADIASS